MNRHRLFQYILTTWLISCCFMTAGSALAVMIKVVDADSGAPIEGAIITADSQVIRTDADGTASLPMPISRLLVRAAGHGRFDQSEKDTDNIVVRLPKLIPKALYLSFYGIGDRELRQSALKLLDETELNALVIDVKGDRGLIPYQSSIPLAAEVGAQKTITVSDMPGLIASLHAKGIYTVARVVAFKDDPLARNRPEWAVHTSGGGVWSDREGMAWSDPFRHEVWNYLIDIAIEAARLGFDEIQFDYVRFPDEPGLVFSKRSNQENRVEAIAGFLSLAAKRLAPYNVFVAADLFGYTLWNKNDTDIGQRLEDLAPIVDYICPMLYPSTFQYGIPGYTDPVAHPFEIVSLSLTNAQKRTGLSALHFRPWLQAFRDYAFDRRPFGAEQISDQIRAAKSFGSDGWMLWNPRNIYTDKGLRKGK